MRISVQVSIIARAWYICLSLDLIVKHPNKLYFVRHCHHKINRLRHTCLPTFVFPKSVLMCLSSFFIPSKALYSPGPVVSSPTPLCLTTFGVCRTSLPSYLCSYPKLCERDGMDGAVGMCMMRASRCSFCLSVDCWYKKKNGD